MDPQKAHALGVHPGDVCIECYAELYGGDWIVFVPDDERGRIILTSTPSAYKAAWWLATLRKLYASN